MQSVECTFLEEFCKRPVLGEFWKLLSMHFSFVCQAWFGVAEETSGFVSFINMYTHTHTHVDLFDSSVEKQERRREQETSRVSDGDGCVVVGEPQNRERERDRECARADRQSWDHLLQSWRRARWYLYQWWTNLKSAIYSVRNVSLQKKVSWPWWEEGVSSCGKAEFDFRKPKLVHILGHQRHLALQCGHFRTNMYFMWVLMTGGSCHPQWKRSGHRRWMDGWMVVFIPVSVTAV